MKEQLKIGMSIFAQNRELETALHALQRGNAMTVIEADALITELQQFMAENPKESAICIQFLKETIEIRNHAEQQMHGKSIDM